MFILDVINHSGKIIEINKYKYVNSNAQTRTNNFHWTAFLQDLTSVGYDPFLFLYRNVQCIT